MKRLFNRLSSLALRPHGIVYGLGLSAAVLLSGCGSGSPKNTTLTTQTASPAISPGTGTYTSVQSVTITDATPGAAIYYTTDGTPPSSLATQYTAPISVATTQTIQAIAYATGDANSTVTSAVFTMNLPTPTAATPVISPSSGTFTSIQSVTITDATSGSTIYYTTDGSTPTTSSTKYAGAITVSATETITAIAAATGYNNSPSASVTIKMMYDLGTLTVPSTTYQLQIENAASSLVLGIQNQSQVAGTSAIQEANSGLPDTMWHYMPYNYTAGQQNGGLENMLTHQALGISGASTAAGAGALQWADNGTFDHLWQFYLLADGNYLIQNVNSGLYLENANSGTTSAATIDQAVRDGCSCQEWQVTQTTTLAYPAPLTVAGTGIYVHDPNMLKDPNGVYWLYGTHQTIAYSTDLKTFTYTTENTPQGACTATQGGQWIVQDNHCPIIGPDFTSWTGLQSPPSDNNGANTDIWAPDVMYANGTYYQYYAVPVEPDTVGGEAIIGMATSTTPYGPWTDGGYIVSSWSNTTNTPITSSYGWNFVAGTTYNAIDPAPYVDADGNWWLVFGSFYDGTHIIQLDPSTGKAKSGATVSSPIAVRYGGEEGPFIYPYVVNGTQYYYYFASANVCCSATSAYRIIMGRSTSPTGPFTDRGGLGLFTADGGTILLSTHANIVGPGGESVFTDIVNGTPTPTLVYHYYDGNNNGTPTLGISRLAFTSDGWPYVE